MGRIVAKLLQISLHGRIIIVEASPSVFAVLVQQEPLPVWNELDHRRD
jgi:hypothetical protein